MMLVGGEIHWHFSRAVSFLRHLTPAQSEPRLLKTPPGHPESDTPLPGCGCVTSLPAILIGL